MGDISRRKLLLLASGSAILVTMPINTVLAATNKYQKQVDEFVAGNPLANARVFRSLLPLQKKRPTTTIR